MIDIKDIKPLLNIQDYSLIYFVLISLFTIVIVILSIIKIYKYIKSKKIISQKNIYINILENIDLTDPKESAYKISKYGKLLAEDTKAIEILQLLNTKLIDYKYKKDIPNQIDIDIKQHLDLFLNIIKTKQ